MQKPTIVIADDYEPMLDTIARLLAERFDVVARVSNGSAAMEAVEVLSPDILVMDIAMPGVNGIDAARRLRDSRSTTKVILLSADVEREPMEWEKLGAHAYVLKARMRSDLVVAIQEIVAGRTYFSGAAAS